MELTFSISFLALLNFKFINFYETSSRYQTRSSEQIDFPLFNPETCAAFLHRHWVLEETWRSAVDNLMRKTPDVSLNSSISSHAVRISFLRHRERIAIRVSGKLKSDRETEGRWTFRGATVQQRIASDRSSSYEVCKKAAQGFQHFQVRRKEK